MKNKPTATEMISRSKWIPCSIQWVPYKIHIDTWIPYIGLRWVSVYKWGPVDIGFWIPELRFYHLQYSRWIKIPIYHRGYWSFYTTKVRVPDPWDIKKDKIGSVFAKTGGVIGGTTAIILSAVSIPASSGVSTPLAYLGMTGGIATASGSAMMLSSELQDPLTYNPDPNPL